MKLPALLLTLLLIAWSSVAAGANVPENIPVKMPEGATHPRVILSTADIAGVRERVATLPWASAIARSVLEKADALAAEQLDIPHREGQWTHWYSCPDDGTTLKAESPTKHVCSTCGRTYSGPPYDAVYVTKRHSHWLQGIEDLGFAYALEPKPEYAKRVRDILVEYASFYGDLELHDIYGKRGTAKDRLFGQTLNSAVALCSMSPGYDIVFDAPEFSAEDHALIESKLLRPMVADIRANPRGISNWQTWHNAAVCGTGLLLGDREYVDWSINGPNGMLYQLNKGSVMPSGMWYEESPSYHWYALEAMVFQLEVCRRSGMDLYEYPIVKGLFAAPVQQLLPDGTFIPLHDSARESIADRRQFYEIAYREYGEPLYAALSQPRRDSWGLFLGAAKMPEDQGLPPMASSNDAGEGLAVMRTTGETVAMMDYGPGVSAHVQPAKLNLVLYALGDIRFVDPGRLPYGNPMHAKWYRQTIAHNTVVVDEKSHAKAPGKLTSWVTDGEMSLVRATCERAYPGVVLDRTLLLKGGLLLDVFVCTAEKECAFDMPLHLQGELEGLNAGEPATPFGNKDGYGVLMDIHSLPGGQLHFRASASDRGSIDVQTFDESENYRALGYGTCSMQEKLPAVIRRQRGTSAVFAAAYQVLKPGESPVAVKWDPATRELSAVDLCLRVGEHETQYATERGGALRTAPNEVAATNDPKPEGADSKANAVRFDFGSEDVAQGYVEANADSVYAASVGHGWLGTPSLHDDIQDKPEALDSDFDRHRDFTWSYTPAEFRIDVPPGTYELAVTSGDFNIGGPATLVSVSGTDVSFPALKPAACEFLTVRAAFVLKQSPLILTFASEEGNNWQVNDLVLRPVDSAAPAVVESNVVKFFEKARVAGQQQGGNRQVRVIASNYPKLDPLTLEGPSPIAELWESYVEELKGRETFERGATTREDYRGFKALLKNRQYPSIPDGAPSLPAFGLIDPGVLDHFTPWGVYVGEDGSARFDLLSRVSLTRRLAEGQLNDHSTELADCLRSGVYTTLFLRSATDPDPVCHAARAALFEMNAMFAAAKAEKNEIGMFKRAAHLALASIEPDGIRSAEEADLVSQLLDTAYEYAAFTEDFPEQPAPEDVSYLVVMKPLAFALPSSPKARPAVPDYLDPAIMKAQLRKVYDFAIAHPRLAQHHGWEKAAFHAGIMRAYLATKDPEYLAESVRWSERAGYDVFMDRRGASNADNLACAQVYLDLYLLQGGDSKLNSIRSIADKIAENPPKGREAWWWCDSLFMAPPVLAKLTRATGDAKYATLMNSLWWDSKDYLFNKNEHLFFRDKRYFEARTEGGKPVIWGRGNGWVLSGLALILTDLPKDDPRYGDYLDIYRQMAAKVASIQGADGMWRTSLADPAEFPMPESSCTAFFTHALAWGVNNGVLDRDEFEPVVRKAWRALNQVVYPTGKIGWVQHVAGAPGMVAPDMTREYAPGAFLLAGSEVLTIVESKQ